MDLLQWLFVLMLLPLLLLLLHLQLLLWAMDMGTVLQLPDMLLSTVDVGTGEMFGRSPDISLVMDRGGVWGLVSVY